MKKYRIRFQFEGVHGTVESAEMVTSAADFVDAVSHAVKEQVAIERKRGLSAQAARIVAVSEEGSAD